MKQKILIVEDDDTIQTQLKTLLSGNGYEADAVTDFSRIIEQFKAFAPHLVLLDIKLPGNSGFEICSQIRGFSDIPIVFVTSSNTDMDELNSIMLSGDAFITKPYNTAILQTVLFVLVVWLMILVSCLLLFCCSRKKYLDKLLDMAEKLDERYLLPEIMQGAGAGRCTGFLPDYEDGRKIHAGTHWRDTEGAAGI